jgi:hypothetical protein
MMGYPPARLLEEVAWLAHHLHWSYSEIITMPHVERCAWIEEVAKIHRWSEERADDRG